MNIKSIITAVLGTARIDGVQRRRKTGESYE